MVEDIAVKLQEALVLHGAGRLGEAEQNYQEILKLEPLNPAALHLLGVVAYQCGHGEKGIGLIRQALAVQREFPEAQSNLGLAYASVERYQEARDAFSAALSLKPQFPEAHSNLGLVYQELGELELALQSHTRAAGLQPESAIYQYNLGLCLASLGRHQAAGVSLVRAIRLQNNYPDAYYNLGLSYHYQARFEESVTAYQQALALNPDHGAALCNLGTTLFEMGRFTEAISSYLGALEIDGHSSDIWHNLGMAHAAFGNHEVAITHYMKAIELQPNHPEAYHNLGNLYRDIGMMPEAEMSYSQAISFEPDRASAHRSRSSVVKHVTYDEQIKEMVRLLEGTELTVDQQMHLGFGLGKAMEDIGDFDRAFDYYQSANRQKREQYQYSAANEEDHFTRLKQAYSAELFDQFDGVGCADDAPVFVVGMPRSGTTLVEQILASHSEVYGAGELMLMAKTAEIFFKSNGRAEYPETLTAVNADSLKRCGADYARELRTYCTSATRITDKMPGNFEFIGLIKLILPNAKIVHCCRGAEDTCLSIYKTYFSSEGHYYAYDLAELGQYYRKYQDLMGHWQHLSFDFIYDIHYEELVSDPEQQARALIAHCGLNWDPACLDFYRTARSVKTASAAQVRRPIYNSSVNAWRRYKSRIEPLLNALRG